MQRVKSLQENVNPLPPVPPGNEGGIMRTPVRQGGTGRFTSLPNPLGNVRQFGGEAVIMAKAPSDGFYTLGRGRYKAKAGAVLPPGAVFEAGLPDDRNPEERRATNPDHAMTAQANQDEDQAEPERTVLMDGFPRWYENYVAEQTSAGKAAHAMYEGETQRKFMERIADYPDASGPDEVS